MALHPRTVSDPGPSELSRHWPAVGACFVLAIYSWGFGFYGQSVYLAALQRAHGWPSSFIAAATTTFYLAGALMLTRVHVLQARIGPRRVLLAGAALMVTGSILFAASNSLWQLTGSSRSP